MPVLRRPESDADEVRLRVLDDGPGCPELEADHLFDLFYRSATTSGMARINRAHTNSPIPAPATLRLLGFASLDDLLSAPIQDVLARFEIFDEQTYVEQVVRNLLSNAAKYGGEGVEVAVIAEAAGPPLPRLPRACARCASGLRPVRS